MKFQGETYRFEVPAKPDAKGIYHGDLIWHDRTHKVWLIPSNKATQWVSYIDGENFASFGAASNLRETVRRFLALLD